MLSGIHSKQNKGESCVSQNVLCWLRHFTWCSTNCRFTCYRQCWSTFINKLFRVARKTKPEVVEREELFALL